MDIIIFHLPNGEQQSVTVEKIQQDVWASTYIKINVKNNLHIIYSHSELYMVYIYVYMHTYVCFWDIHCTHQILVFAAVKDRCV